MKKQFTKIKFLVLAAIMMCASAAEFKAQTTAFTYQGRFVDSTAPQPTNGTYEMQFKLFNAAQNGSQIGGVQVIPTVQVVNGIFTVQLDAENSFSGADLFIEIGVRPAGSQAALTTLAPRQQVTSAPYAIQSRNALTAINSDNLANMPASNYTQNNDTRLSDDRNPTAGSINYVQNQNAAAQLSTNFNISGNGTADTFNAATQFNIGGNRVLSVKGNSNLFAGVNAGTAIANGLSNTFVGNFAGNANTNGYNNAFFGTDAGRNNQGDLNSFFGRSSGYDTTTGSSNSFFGLDAGRYNQTGSNNAFFGRIAGNKNNADNNAFFGFYSGGFTTTGGNNAFFGYNAGVTNTIGANNTIIGSGANVGANNLNFATAIGAGAVVSSSNTIVLGTSTTSTEIPGTLKVFTLGAAGGTILCRNATNLISDCPAGTGSYIQNSTVQQPTSNFNISGSGTLGGTLSANVVNSATSFKLGNSPVFSTPNVTSLVAGQQKDVISIGSDNSFFGYYAGQLTNSSAQFNTFIGSSAGFNNSGGNSNTFVGSLAGYSNNSSNGNSFYGYSAGFNNTAFGNSFFGFRSGLTNETGQYNSFFGFLAGFSSKTANYNTFFGYEAGLDTTGGQNTIFGAQFHPSVTTGYGNSLFGFDARAMGDGNTVLGGSGVATGNNNVLIGDGFVDGNFNTIVGSNANTQGIAVQYSTAIGVGAVVTTNNTIVLGRASDTTKIPGSFSADGTVTANGNLSVAGKLTITTLGAAGSTSLCRNSLNQISLCTPGNFADGDSSAAMMKEISDQKAQLEAQQKQLLQQQSMIENLRKLVCASNPTADVCRQ